MIITTKDLLEGVGYTIGKVNGVPYAFKKVGEKEISIEFCIGDYCVGIYDKDLNLIGQKKRCDGIAQAIVEAEVLENKEIAKNEKQI